MCLDRWWGSADVLSHRSYKRIQNSNTYCRRRFINTSYCIWNSFLLRLKMFHLYWNRCETWILNHVQTKILRWGTSSQRLKSRSEVEQQSKFDSQWLLVSSGLCWVMGLLWIVHVIEFMKIYVMLNWHVRSHIYCRLGITYIKQSNRLAYLITVKKKEKKITGCLLQNCIDSHSILLSKQMVSLSRRYTDT